MHHKSATKGYHFQIKPGLCSEGLISPVCASNVWITNIIQYHTVPYYTIPYHTVPYHTIPYHTIPYNTIQYNTIQYNTIQLSLASWPIARIGFRDFRSLVLKTGHKLISYWLPRDSKTVYCAVNAMQLQGARASVYQQSLVFISITSWELSLAALAKQIMAISSTSRYGNIKNN